jgi:Signal transduction histidine kinase
MIFNLVDNAIRYTEQGGKVVVLVEPNAIVVKDTGIGIPKECQSRIFERFYRVDKSRSKETGGTGLGLAIVKHIAEVLHATIHLNSTVGFGTEVRIGFTPFSKATKVV